MIETLKAYQAWRRGDDERTLEDTGLTPAMIGEAIDWAIGAAEERDRLAAQSEQLKQQLDYMAQQHSCGCGHPACNRCYDDRENNSILAATPAQCLAEIKAQAVEDTILYFSAKADKAGQSAYYAQQYANQIRQNTDPLSKVNKTRDLAKHVLDTWIAEENT